MTALLKFPERQVATTPTEWRRWLSTGVGALLLANLLTQWLVIIPRIDQTASRLESVAGERGDADRKRVEALREHDELLKSIRIKAATIQVIQDRQLKDLKGK